MSLNLEAQPRLTGSVSAQIGSDVDNLTLGFGHEADLKAFLTAGVQNPIIPSDPISFELQFFAKPALSYAAYARTAAVISGDQSLRYGQSSAPFTALANGPWLQSAVSGGLGLWLCSQFVTASFHVASPYNYNDQILFAGGAQAASNKALRFSTSVLLKPLPGLRLETQVVSGAFFLIPQNTLWGLRGEIDFWDLGFGSLAAAWGGDVKTRVYLDEENAYNAGLGLRLRLPGPYGGASDLWSLNSDRVFSGLSMDSGLIGDCDPLTPQSLFYSLSYYQSRKAGLLPGVGGFALLETHSPLNDLQQWSHSLECGLEGRSHLLVVYAKAAEHFQNTGSKAVQTVTLGLGLGLEDFVMGMDWLVSWDSNDLIAGWGTAKDKLGRIVSTLRVRF